MSILSLLIAEVASLKRGLRANFVASQHALRLSPRDYTDLCHEMTMAERNHHCRAPQDPSRIAVLGVECIHGMDADDRARGLRWEIPDMGSQA